MNDRIGVGGLGIEALTNEQTCLAMGIAARADPPNVRRERDIARHPLPDEVQRVFAKPHILSAAGNEVALLPDVISDRARHTHGADVTMTLEQAKRRILAQHGRALKEATQTQKNCELLGTIIHAHTPPPIGRTSTANGFCQ